MNTDFHSPGLTTSLLLAPVEAGFRSEVTISNDRPPGPLLYPVGLTELNNVRSTRSGEVPSSRVHNRRNIERRRKEKSVENYGGGVRIAVYRDRSIPDEMADDKWHEATNLAIGQNRSSGPQNDG